LNEARVHNERETSSASGSSAPKSRRETHGEIGAEIAKAVGGRWIDDIDVPASDGAGAPRLSLVFDTGDPAQLPPGTSLAYSRKGLVDIDGTSLFAELAVVRLFRRAGWNADWWDGFGGGWVADGDLDRGHLRELPSSPARSLVKRIVAGRGGQSGCWDVVAWTDDLVAFAECKRRACDRLTKTQGRWLRACLDAEVAIDAFVVVEWDFG
jgi:hypothetical protein